MPMSPSAIARGAVASGYVNYIRMRERAGGSFFDDFAARGGGLGRFAAD